MAEAKNEQQQKKALNIGLILQLAFAVTNLVVVGGGAYLTYVATLGWHSPAITEEQLASESEKLQEDPALSAPLVYTMDEFTVNLAGDPLKGEPKRTIRIEVNLEMLGKDGFEEVISSDNKTRARDRIVGILNSKYFSEVESIQGKLFLKDQILREINSILEQGVVRDVYFSQFVVQ